MERSVKKIEQDKSSFLLVYYTHKIKSVTGTPYFMTYQAHKHRNPSLISTGNIKHTPPPKKNMLNGIKKISIIPSIASPRHALSLSISDWGNGSRGSQLDYCYRIMSLILTGCPKPVVLCRIKALSNKDYFLS